MLAYARGEWRALVLVVLLSAFASGLAAVQPWPLKILIDFGLSGAALPAWAQHGLAAVGLPSSALTIIIGASIAGIAVPVLNAAVDAAVTLTWSRAGPRMVYRLATELFFHLQRLSLLFHARRTVGDALSRVTGDAWGVYAIAENILITPLRNGMVIASVSILAWQLSPALTSIVLATVPFLVVSMSYFGNRLRGIEKLTREAQARLTALAHQTLGAIPVVQVFGAANRNTGIFGSLAADVVRARQKGAVLTQSYSALNGTATTVGVALVVYLGGQKVLANDMSLGTLVVFIVYVRSLEGACRGLLQMYAKLKSAEASADRILEVLDSREVVTDMPNAKALPPRAARSTGHIFLQDVTFGYEPERPVLRDLTLEIQPGETLALVGSSGAGKTTLASLVLRLFDPWHGRVLLDGMNVRNIRLTSLRSEIGVVLQDSFLLPISVLDNIAYGRPDASRDDVIAAAVAANAHEFIRKLPDGYDTLLGEQGATLSGGQQQRIAIARALLKDPRVLILDEPTASLDAETERLVMEALERLMAGRTTLIIAHRLATVRRAIRIAVIHGGRIVEVGTHGELLSAGGRYAQLYALSALGATPGSPE